MKLAVRTIDRALKRLYQLEAGFRAESFLLRRPPKEAQRAANRDMRGTLYVLSNSENPADLTLGIYFTEKVKNELDNFLEWKQGSWTAGQWAAFLVAAEEVSHFHYVVHNASNGRPVSQLDLEIQGEIDKFALAFFANLLHEKNQIQLFDAVFSRVFEKFSLHEDLNDEQKTRYREAHQIAKHWVTAKRPDFVQDVTNERAITHLRNFYRLSPHARRA